MPKLVRFLLVHATYGFLIALAAVGSLLFVDAFSIRSLIAGSPDGFLALFVLVFMMGLTFASVQMGAAVMLLGSDDDTPKGGRRERIGSSRLPALTAIPARLSKS